MLYVLTESTKLLWTPDSAHRETDVYAVDLCCCINPFCGCTTLDMTIRSQRHAETTYTFSVDVEERVLYEPENLSERDCAFANDFIKGCDDADWVRLCSLFCEQRRRVAETSDIQSFEPPLILFKGIEFGDTMVTYSEVFPFAAANQFVLGDVEYFIDEQYCLAPGCTCTKVAVTFVGVHDAKPVAADGLYPMSRFDYHKKRWDHEIGINASPHNCRQLTSAFQQSAPDLAALLKKRHALLKSAYALCKKNNAAGSNVLDKFNIPQISRDTGRNAPCPCGSGKKYKKCCGK